MIDIADLFQATTIVKLALSLMIFFYLIFLFVLINQIKRMNIVVSQATSSTVMLGVGIVFFAFAVLLFILAIVIL